MVTVTRRFGLRAASCSSSFRKMKSRGARQPRINSILPAQPVSVRYRATLIIGVIPTPAAISATRCARLPSKTNVPFRCFHLHLVPHLQLVVEEAGRKAVRLALDGDFDPV